MRKLTIPIVICAISVVTAIISWNFLFNSLYGLEEGWAGIWIKPMISFLILGVMLGLTSLLIESKKILIPTFLLTIFSFFLVFHFNKYVLLGLVLFLGLLWLGCRRIKDEAEVRLKIRIGRILQKGLPLILTGLIIVVSVAYCFTPSAQKIEIKIPPKLFEIIQKPIGEILSSEFPKENLKELPEEVKKIIDAKIEEFTRPYQKYIPLALAISLFFFLRLVAIPLGWLIILLSWTIFKLLLAFKVIRIEKAQKEAEMIKA